MRKTIFPSVAYRWRPKGSEYWSNSLECEPAMLAYNSTSIQIGVYDLSGTQSTEAFGNGKQLCMCFDLQHKEGELLDICLLVGVALEIRERQGFFSGLVAVGIQNPESNKGKMLPLCTSGSASSAGAQTNAGTKTTGFVTATSTPVRTVEGSKTTSSSQYGSIISMAGADVGQVYRWTQALLRQVVAMIGRVVSVLTVLLALQSACRARLWQSQR
jgi:hypothetical protein